MKEFWLFFTQQYLQWVQTNPNLVVNLSKVEGFLFDYGGYKTVTGRFHWGGSNLNEIVGTLIVQRLEISHGYCKPLILSPMLSGFYPCCCIKIALVSHQNQVSRSSGLLSLLLSPNIVDGFPLKHCLHFACRSSLYLCPFLKFLAILSVIYSSLPDFWTMTYSRTQPSDLLSLLPILILQGMSSSFISVSTIYVLMAPSFHVWHESLPVLSASLAIHVLLPQVK